jgi:hypothetical protein
MYCVISRSGIMKKASPEILYISKQQGGLGFPDLTSVFKQSQLTRADILSTSVGPLISTVNHESWLVHVGAQRPTYPPTLAED